MGPINIKIWGNWRRNRDRCSPPRILRLTWAMSRNGSWDE